MTYLDIEKNNQLIQNEAETWTRGTTVARVIN